MINSNFCHLHVHNEYSLLDGMGKAKEYAMQAKEMGFTHLALTNHGNIDGCIEFQKECLKADIAPIFGCELYVCDGHATEKTRHSYHMTLLVENEVGWATICGLLAYANEYGFYYRARVGMRDIVDTGLDGLFILTGCANSFLMSEHGIEFLESLAMSYPGRLYTEIMPHAIPEYKPYVQIAMQLDLPFVATNDCHYVLEEDWEAQNTLLKIQRKDFEMSLKGLHLRSAQEMVAAFQRQGYFTRNMWLNGMRNTMLIARQCNYRIPRHPISLPTPPAYRECNHDVMLKEMCETAVIELKGDGIINELEMDEVRERMRIELSVVADKKFSTYFLIVKDILDFCLREKILYGPGRGSVGGCMIAYLLGITNVNPLTFNLLFDRFINKDRIDFPDIDLDFPYDEREKVLKYVVETYGSDRVAGMSTFLGMKAKAVVRDLGRVFALPTKEVDEFAKSLWDDDSKAKWLPKKVESAFAKNHPEEFQMMLKLEHQIRGVGQHASGYVLSADPINTSNRGHLSKRGNKMLLNWSMDAAEKMGFVKVDLLGLRNLAILRDVQAATDINYLSLALDSQEVLASITHDNTAGLFQVSGMATTDLLKYMQIKTFEDIAVIVSIARPGPADAEVEIQGAKTTMTKEYIRRRDGGGWVKMHPLYEEVTSETYGIPVYQEQVMGIVNRVAGLPWSKADEVRKVIGKKRDRKEFEPYRKMFVDGCARMGTMSAKEANDFWDGLLKWSSYGFNKCLSGDTVLIRSSANQHSKQNITVEELYNTWYSKSYAGSMLRYRGLQIMQMDDDYQVRPGQMKDITHVGKQKVFKIITSGGKSITASANHRFLTPIGYKKVEELIAQDEIIIATAFVRGYTKTGKRHKSKGGYRGSGFPDGEKNPFFIDGRTDVFNKSKIVVRRRSNGKCERCGKSDQGRMEFAHIRSLEECQNNYLVYHSANNITRLCNSCHKLFDYSKGERKRRHSKGKGTHIECIASITYNGVQDTYDIEMDTPRHNFVANSFISHNSHAIEYAMLAYWEAYCKLYYPLEYFAAALTHSRDEHKDALIRNAYKLGIEIVPPKFRKSDATKWVVEDGKLIAPFSTIKNIGESKAQECVDAGKKQLGFFTIEEEANLGVGGQEVLSKIGAYKEGVVADASKYLTINIVSSQERWKMLPLRGDRSQFPRDMIMPMWYRDASVLGCNKCDLRAECKGPVPTAVGKYNIFIVGEAPGDDEDKAGIGFIGPAGRLLWEEMAKVGLRREMFHISNVVHCWPGKLRRTPTQTHANMCAGLYLRAELERTLCKLIFGLGNTVRFALTGEPKGITSVVGKTEWVAKVNAFVSWGVHPSSILRGNDREDFVKGVAGFANAYKFLRRGR